MSLWETLVIENPMLIEVRRYRRRLLGGGRTTGTNIAFLTLGAVCYVGLLLIVGSANGGIPGIAIIMIQTGIFTVAAPIVLNNAIAGEREKRTWDLLLVAPVTKAQIMIGKFAGAMTSLLFGAALFLLPVFICAVSYSRTDFGGLLLAELDSIAFAVFCCSLSLLFSARCRRGFTALGVSLGILAIWLIVLPLLLSGISDMDAVTRDFIYVLHPFMAETRLIQSGRIDDASMSGMTTATIQIFVYLGLAAVLLVWTERTLTFSDNEVKFLPKSHASS